MAKQQSHFTFSFGVALIYVFCGLYFLSVYSEYLLLAAVVIVITGLLPNIDQGGEAPARELAGLLAAVSPLVFFEYFPGVLSGGVARIVLVVICCYAFTRIVVVQGLQKLTVHRGLTHSLPAAILTFELTYLLFWDLFWVDRLFVAGAAFAGYFSHLLLDAYGNLDILGGAMGKASKKSGALKLKGKTWGPTIAIYASVIYFGYFVLVDFYPGIRSYVRI